MGRRGVGQTVPQEVESRPSRRSSQLPAGGCRVSDPLRVLIVEDHQVLADGLELAIGRHSDLAVVGQAGTVADATRLAAESAPDVVLMDYHLPDGSGADAARAIRKQLPGTAVVILTAETSEDAVLASVEAGAVGFLRKSEAAEKVVEAVRRAAEGEMLIPPAMLVGLIARQRQRAQEEAERNRLLGELTPREREVLQLMSKGFDNKTIAEQMVISLTTVRGYVQNVLEKLDAHSKLEAVARAGEYGLLDA